MLQEQIWLWDQAMILKFISANIGYQDQAFKINHIQSSNNFRCPQDLEKIEKNCLPSVTATNWAGFLSFTK